MDVEREVFQRKKFKFIIFAALREKLTDDTRKISFQDLVTLKKGVTKTQVLQVLATILIIEGELLNHLPEP